MDGLTIILGTAGALVSGTGGAAVYLLEKFGEAAIGIGGHFWKGAQSRRKNLFFFALRLEQSLAQLPLDQFRAYTSISPMRQDLRR